MNIYDMLLHKVFAWRMIFSQGCKLLLEPAPGIALNKLSLEGETPLKRGCRNTRDGLSAIVSGCAKGYESNLITCYSILYHVITFSIVS